MKKQSRAPSFISIGLLAVFFAIYPVQSTYAGESSDIQITAGAYNHLTLSFVILRQGVGADQIRTDILDNIDYSQIKPEIKTLYRKLIGLAETFKIKQNELSKKSTAARNRATSSNEANGIKQLIGLATTGDPTLALLQLLMTSTDSAEELTSNDTMKVDASVLKELGPIITDLEFDISVARNQLAREYNIPNEAFLRTQDIEAYLKLKSRPTNDQAYYTDLAQLHGGAPALYQASWELAYHALDEKRYEDAEVYAKEAIEHTPQILLRNRILADSRAILGMIEGKNNNFDAAEALFTQAISGNPTNRLALAGLSYLYITKNRSDKAAKIINNWLRKDPNQPHALWLKALVQYRTGETQDTTLSTLKKAFDHGFNNVALVKTTLEGEAISTSPLFKAMTQMKAGYGVNWNALVPDQLTLTNKSDFDWSNVNINVIFKDKYSARTRQQWQYIDGANAVRIPILKRNESFTFDAYNSTQMELVAIKITIKTDQGEHVGTFRNHQGQFSSAKP